LVIWEQLNEIHDTMRKTEDVLQSFFFAGFLSLLSLGADSFASLALASDAFAAESLLSFDSDFVAGGMSLPVPFFPA
jgi:hypothetical protein